MQLLLQFVLQGHGLFSCRQLLFFDLSFARGIVFSSSATTIRILRRHVRQFWYLPAAGEAAAAARGLAAWCFSSADVREFLGAVLAAAGGSGTRSSFRSVVFPPGKSSKYRTRSSSSNSCSSRGFWRGSSSNSRSSSSSMRTSNSRRQQNLSKNVVFLGFQTTR